MDNAVLVALADGKYVDQAKQLFSAAYWKAGWDGDYLLLAYGIADEHLAWFTEKKILIRKCDSFLPPDHKYTDQITACKAYMFAEEFKRWENVVYLDVDVIIRAPIDELTSVTGFAACRSMWQTIGDNFVDLSGMPVETAEEVRASFDLQEGAFNSGVLAFHTSIIGKQTLSDLQACFAKYIRLGEFGGDQLPLNVFFYKRWKRLPAVYNYVISLEDSYSLNPHSVTAILIHLVGFGGGPWNPRSAFNAEWRESLGRANFIDLSDIPKPRSWSPREVATHSNRIARSQLLGGQRLSLVTLLQRAGRLIYLFRTDFRAGSRKLKAALIDLLGRGR